MQRDAIACLRHILADEPHAGEMVVHLDDLRVLGAPRALNGVGCYASKSESGQGLHLVPASKAAGRIMPRFILDDSSHLGATVEVHPPGHDGIDRARHMPHVVAAACSCGRPGPRSWRALSEISPIPN